MPPEIDYLEKVMQEIARAYPLLGFDHWRSDDREAQFIKEINDVNSLEGAFPDLTMFGFKKARKNNMIWWTNIAMQKTRYNVSSIMAEVEKPNPEKDKIKNHLSVLENL